MSEMDLEKVRKQFEEMLEWYPCPLISSRFRDAIQLADEVELGNSVISKQIEVNSGLRKNNAKLLKSLGAYAEALVKARSKK